MTVEVYPRVFKNVLFNLKALYTHACTHIHACTHTHLVYGEGRQGMDDLLGSYAHLGPLIEALFGGTGGHRRASGGVV